MNRAERRARNRATIADLRTSGCCCTPTLTQIDRVRIDAVGADDGLYVLHRRGCPLGDRVYALNLLGIVPQAFATTTTTRCGR